MESEIKFKLWLPMLAKMTYGLSIKDWANGYEQITVSDDCVWLQFTGLKDKNGKEIYEGDVIEVDWLDARYKVKRYPVEWNNERCAFDFPGGSPYNDSAYFKVIGNKFQNPELLDSTKQLTNSPDK